MFKFLALQQPNNLLDGRIKYQRCDRYSFMRFLGLEREDRLPDAKTVWLFREQLKVPQLSEALFAQFNEQLAGHGYVARNEQVVDVTFTEVSRQRNKREECGVAGAVQIRFVKMRPEGVDHANR